MKWPILIIIGMVLGIVILYFWLSWKNFSEFGDSNHNEH